MGRIWAVARQMIREAIRMKIAIVFVVLLVTILPTLPLVMEGDGTLRGRVQAFLHYSLGAASLILSLLTLFLASGSLSAEVRLKHVQMVLTKPVARWQFIAGKWLGIAVLNAVLLSGSGLGIYAATQYLKGGREGPQGDRDRLLREVLTARDARRPTVPQFGPQVNARYEELRERGELPDQSPAITKQKLLDMALGQWRSISPLQGRRYEITNLHFVDRRPEERIYIRYKLNLTGRPPDEMVHSYWRIGDPTKGGRSYEFARSDKFDAYHELPVPADAVADDGTLRVIFYNQHRTGADDDTAQAIADRTFPATLSFEDGAGFEVLYRIGSFGANFVRSLTMLYCWLLFLAALGLFAASFLSFPVACMLCMLVYFTALGASYFNEAVSETDSMGRLIKYVAMTFLSVIPDFGYYDPVPTLADGRLVTLKWVLYAIASVGVVRTAIIGAIACAIFQRRELAEVVV